MLGLYLSHFTQVVLVVVGFFVLYVVRCYAFPNGLRFLNEPRWFFKLRRRLRRWYWRQRLRPLFANLLHIVGILFTLASLVWSVFVALGEEPFIPFW